MDRRDAVHAADEDDDEEEKKERPTAVLHDRGARIGHAHRVCRAHCLADRLRRLSWHAPELLRRLRDESPRDARGGRMRHPTRRRRFGTVRAKIGSSEAERRAKNSRIFVRIFVQHRTQGTQTSLDCCIAHTQTWCCSTARSSTLRPLPHYRTGAGTGAGPGTGWNPRAGQKAPWARRAIGQRRATTGIPLPPICTPCAPSATRVAGLHSAWLVRARRLRSGAHALREFLEIEARRYRCVLYVHGPRGTVDPACMAPGCRLRGVEIETRKT